MSIVFYLVAFFVFYLDFLIWGALTPTIIVFSGFLCISIFYDLFGRLLGFVEVVPDIYIYLVLFLWAGFISSFLVRGVFGGVAFKRDIEFGGFLEGREVFWFFVFCLSLLLLFLVYGVFNAYRAAGKLVGEDFEFYLSSGLVGHAFSLLMASVPFTYLFLTTEKYGRYKRVTLFVLLLSFVLLFLKQVKYWVLVPFVWLFLIKIYRCGLGRSLVLLLRGAGLVGVSFSVFFLVYFGQAVYAADGLGGVDVAGLSIDIVNHFMGYLFSGILVFSKLAEGGVFDALAYRDFMAAFNGFFNLVGFLFGSGLYEGDYFYVDFYVLNEVTGKTGNVGSLWADFLVYLGWLAFFVFFFVMLLVYILFWLSRFFGWGFVCYSGVVSFLFFSWFSSYFKLLSPYEVPVLSVSIYFVLSLFSRVRLDTRYLREGAGL